ncbi:MAG: asparagine synthase-related protein [Deltaproteobacteria bacterium]|nr:asparagine synthase-related protein [Deltaproteobacteria bacterium]
MPGIAGIVDFKQDGASTDTQIRRMVKILNHTSPAEEEIYIAKHAAIGAVRLKVYSLQNLVAEDTNTAITFWGYLWDQEDLKKRTGLNFQNMGDVSAGNLLLTLYNKEGIDGLCNLNGRFVIAIWNKREKVLNLINDRYGFCKLFYWVTPQRILFASEYKAIVWHEDFPKKIDQQGLADFMALGYSTQDRTFFVNIKLLPPASVATFKSDGNLSIKKYWDYSFHSEDDPLWLEEDYVDQFAEMLAKATQRQIDPNKSIALPLSGGLDSRTLAGVLDRLDFKGEVKAFSYGNQCAYDVAYGRNIAKNVGYEHGFIPIESTYLRDQAERFVWLLEGTVNCLNAHMLLTYPFIRENSLDSIMTGFFGDIICGSWSHFYSLGVHGGTDDEGIIKSQYALHADIMKDKDMAVYMKDSIYQTVRGKTFETLRSRYFQCPSRNRYFRSRYFSTLERQRQYTSFNLHVFDFVAEVASPFLDCDFVDFIYHVPSELMIFQNLYRKMIVKYLPKVASVPHNETKLPLNVSWIRKGLQWRWEGLIRNPLIRATIGRRYAKMNDNYLNTHEAIKTGSRDFVEKSVRNNEFLAQFFKIERVNELLDNHLSGKAHEPSKITALLTLALWSKMFVENEKPTFK